ncbi:tyrosine-protein kinase [Mucilaginibacter sp. SG564]|uniref:GumC family protein n=1 Tax=Mucilaginibacter sp. SG564 TaxID=2587022 RepID=UPI0015573F2F|nr:tyrosine-protein kinase [Mucilaginibacter sp. SG564]NOW97030.1 capsular exopolysaccharide synthesis family protein [Mucilaginibacter sp. SG564]
MNQASSNQNLSSKEGVDLKSIIAKVRRRWYLFLISIALCLFTAFFYLKYTAPSYKIFSKVLVEDNKSNSLSSSSGSNGMVDLSSLLDTKSNADNEIQILQSRSLMKQVVDQLKLNQIIYKQGTLSKKELYDEAPFDLTVISKKDTIISREFELVILKNNKFRIINSDEDIDMNEVSFGTVIKLSQYDLVFSENKNKLIPGAKYKVNIVSKDSKIESLSKNFKAELSDKKVTTIDLSLKYPNPKKGEVILQTLMNLYLKENLENKISIADSTLVFINDRLNIVGKELGGVEGQLEKFKINNNIADIDGQSQALISSSVDYVDKLNTVNAQLGVLDQVETYIKSSDLKKSLPSSLSIQDPVFAYSLQAYNTLLIDRDKQSLSYTNDNPYIKNLDLQIDNARANLLKSFYTYKKGLELNKQQLVAQNNNFKGQIKTVPGKERIFLDYSRQQTVKQQLYLYLLQKREETAISKTSTISTTRIIDNAKSEFAPSEPNRNNIYIIGFVIGLLIPFLIISIQELLNVKIISKADILKESDISILAEISHNTSGDSIVVAASSRSVISEQFRSLRTNLQFLLASNKPNVIIITSSMSGEGKSFISLNLGLSLALMGKKVLFMELDLRKPKLSSSVGMDNQLGFTNYIIGEQTDVSSIIKPLWMHENCYLISSGPIPPNPSELLLNEKVDAMMTELKEQFDYIIMDTAPIGLVSDALIVEKYADSVMYIVRQNYTFKSQLGIVNELKSTGKIRKPYLVVNDIKANDGGYQGYGYGYGYGYGNYSEEVETSWFSKLFKK